ncbi:hypothetical protein GCM10027037_09850 [Mucilaginibacter koreensis]
MTIKQADVLLYILKSVIGTAIGYYIYSAYPGVGAWCLISIVLVLTPDRKDGTQLAINRIKANLIGAAIGLILFFIHPMNLLMMSIGVALAIIICELLKLQAVTRSAAVAVLIILVHEKGKYFWDVALERAAGVVGGCLIAILLTLIFHAFVDKAKQIHHENFTE